MRIGAVDTNDAVAIVAELGNNHEGSIACARELVAMAAEAGAHAVKLQAIDPQLLVRASEVERLKQLERFRLTPDEHAELAEIARSYGLGYLCTPFSMEAVDWLSPLVDAFKIASGDNDFAQLIERAASTGRPLIISTGMSDDTVIATALETARSAPEVALLHCVSAYPTPLERAALASIPALRARFAVTVGYSDHTLGIAACLTAVAAGARIVEKHVTLDHHQSDFRDHQLSAEPGELRELVSRVAEVEVLLGQPRSGVFLEEQATQAAARRSIVASQDLQEGHLIEPGDLNWLRPRDGLPPGHEEQLIGTRLKTAVSRGDALGVLPGDVVNATDRRSPAEG